jgi:hypothetical protein
MITKVVKIYHDTIACERYNMLTTQNEMNVILYYTSTTVVDILCVTDEYMYKC